MKGFKLVFSIVLWGFLIANAQAQNEWDALPGEIEPKITLNKPLLIETAKTNSPTFRVIKSSDGQTLDSIPIVHDNMHGLRKIYVKGYLQQEIPYVHGKINGEKKYYFPNGALRASTEYQNNLRLGKRIIYYKGRPDRTLKKHFHINYFMGLPHGAMRVYSAPPNWNLVSRTEYVNGRKTGEYTEYDTRGYKRLTIPYHNDEISDSAHTHYANGNILCTFWYREFKEKQGSYAYYDKSGKLMHRNTWNEGQPIGIIHKYNIEGKLEEEAGYVNGQLHGLYKKYSQVQILELKCFYTEGSLDGVKSEYWENGNRKLETPYERNMKNGRQMIYDETGLLLQSIDYKDDVVHGNSIIYFDNGTVFVETPFVDGKKHGKEIWYNKAGKKLVKNKWKAGQYANEHKEFYTYGKLKSVHWFDANGNGYQKDNFNGMSYGKEIYYLDNKEVNEEDYLLWKKSR